MIYRNNRRRLLVPALLLTLVLFGISPFISGISTPAAAAAPPSAVAGSAVTDKQTRARAAESFGKLPLYFVENRGQLDKRVSYYVQGSDKTIYFTNQGLTFLLSSKPEAHNEAALQPAANLSLAGNPQSSRWSLKLDFVGARPGVRPEGREQTGATFSYFKGRRSQWQAGLKSYSEIVYRELWPGIDLVYAGTVNRMKYTFVVRPGADPNRIKLAWRGASGVKLNAAGELEVTTPAGGFTDERPVSWQETNGQQVDVATKYRIEAQRKQPSNAAIAYGFELGEYDRSRELVIDPAVLVYCGFIGGGDQDEAEEIAVDSAGNAYVTGTTSSTEASFPVKVGPDLTFNGPFRNAFVAKVNAAGTALVYCGYIGGAGGFAEATGIAVDSAGNAYVTGGTSSTEASFPVTVGPDLTFNGSNDAFVAKVNPSGTALVYCGYIGGSSGEEGLGIAVDSTGNAYVTGSTGSTEADFPVTAGPDLTHNGGSDAFVAKVNAGGTALVYSGYIGGSSSDSGQDIAVDSAGNAYVTGNTSSTEASFPVTVGPDLTQNGGFSDAFVAKVNAGGTTLVYSGYIGGSDFERGVGIAVDSAGNAYVTGATASTEASFPVTVGPDLTFNGSFIDAFVAKVNAGGTALVYCGYIGGSGSDSGEGIAVDSAGNAYITGDTGSTEASFPVKFGPDLTFNGGSDDAFMAKVNAGGTALVSCGYIGGSNFDLGNGIAVDSAGNAYLTGNTRSTEATGFPVTVGPDLTFNSGFNDVFVAKISTPVPSSVAGWGLSPLGGLNIPAGLDDAVAIAAGDSFSLALKSDGTVVGWGSNLVGETTPPAGLTNVVAIAASSVDFGQPNGLSVALKSDGTIVTWGLLGEQSIPGNARAISAGGFHILALQNDGTVLAFGFDFFDIGVLNVPPGLSGVTAVSAGVLHNLALKSDGTIVGWGDNSFGQLNVPPGLSGVTAISAGPTHNLALKSDGTVVAWGTDQGGVLNVPAGLNHVVAISAGAFHDLALKSDGTVVGWGENQFCQSTPPSCITGVRAISTGFSHNMTLQAQSCVQIGCSPQQDLSGLIAQIQALIAAGTLTQNQGAGLIDKINQVIVKLDSGQTDAACNQLSAFITQVNAFINNHTLNPSQGQPLIDGANAIKADIGCP